MPAKEIVGGAGLATIVDDDGPTIPTGPGDLTNLWALMRTVVRLALILG